MMPAKYDVDLIQGAWDDFVDRLRWRLTFDVQDDTLNSVKDDFDPDYWVRRARVKRADPLDRAFEYGILEGGRAITQMVSHMPKNSEYSGGPKDRAPMPPVSVLRDYLTAHQLVVLVTDKNLGCACVSRSWIVEKTLLTLSSPRDYTEITRKQAVEITWDKHETMKRISRKSEEYQLQSQLPDYFVSQCRLDVVSAMEHLPKFYVIPKIHKNPVGARPILPCHSVAQGPAGKFISKMLKPIIRNCPYVIHGTKHLAIKLSKLSLPYRKSVEGVLKRLYLVSGDVVAFYPNVDTNLAHQIALDKLTKYYADREDEDISVEQSVQWLDVFRDCLTAADDNLICQFDGRYFKQARGLAMGVACSPDLANLYGDFHESLPGGILEDKDLIPFYGRYIDDCIALVYASSPTEAENIMRRGLIFSNCTITWSASDNYMTFLDMTLFFEEGRLLHKPFRKPLNHFERIPWISSHPLYVKRGTFCGELSRVATLSSRFDDYSNACKEVADIYIARGYPPLLIAAWLRGNYRARWESRLVEPPSLSADVLVLKSEYNISWDFFNVQTLSERLRAGWALALRTLAYGSPVAKDLPLDIQNLRPRTQGLGSLLQTPESSSIVGMASDRLVLEGLFGPFLRLDKFGLFTKKLLVSKKCNLQLIDLTSMWRRVVLERCDRQVFKDYSKGTLGWFWQKQSQAGSSSSPTGDGGDNAMDVD
ncbi:hypothetical protein AN958_03738 [Leucoagaricus sp. SymC.cos]|nr:hypothetical protein AN958_03738 [Leucoagaricus sp. SymC.cos]